MVTVYSAKMQRISEVLQFPVIVERRGPLSLEPQAFQEFDLRSSCMTTERGILKELGESWFRLERFAGLPFNKLKPLRVSRGESAV